MSHFTSCRSHALPGIRAHIWLLGVLTMTRYQPTSPTLMTFSVSIPASSSSIAGDFSEPTNTAKNFAHHTTPDLSQITVTDRDVSLSPLACNHVKSQPQIAKSRTLPSLKHLSYQTTSLRTAPHPSRQHTTTRRQNC